MNWDILQTLLMIALITIGGFIAVNLLADYVKGKWKWFN